MTKRAATAVIAILDTLACAAILAVYFNSDSDPATIGFDHAAGAVVTALFVVTVLPALVLAALRRAPNTALGLAWRFPGCLSFWPRRSFSISRPCGDPAQRRL
jgi:amino acid transporter